MPRKTIKATEPQSVWTRPLRLHSQDLFRAVSHALIHGATGQWTDLAIDATDGATALGLTGSPSEATWLLVTRSLRRAIVELIAEQDLLRAEVEEAEKKLDLLVSDLSIEVDERLFTRPSELRILTELKKPLSRWLLTLNANPAQIATILGRVASYFVFALREEWRDNSNLYSSIVSYFGDPFAEAVARESTWRDYDAYLQRRLDDPIFGETFALRQVYVPLRATPPGSGRLIVDLHEHLMRWLGENKQGDAIRIISGGPGSGKSSFCRVFAADQSARGRRVVYVPLHDIDSNLSWDAAVGRYLQSTALFVHNPLDAREGDESILLILDGLDELAMQGRAAVDAARSFLRQVDRDVLLRNHSRRRISVVTTGRDVLLQSAATEVRPEQILYLLPYYFPKDARDVYMGTESKLNVDQRDSWWSFYGTAIGRTYASIPTELRRDELSEVTSQPLLSYLVGLSYSRGKIDFNRTVSANEIYHELIVAVYERTYASRPHPAVEGLTKEEFFRVLEEIALATWHGSGRAASIAQIGKYCDRSGLTTLLTRFTEEASSGVIRLLTAFYFRQQGHHAFGEQVFEFTHKSFAEYLAARRIIHTLARITDELETRRTTLDRGWSENEALTHWLNVCGFGVIDSYLLRFIQGEAALAAGRVRHWQLALERLVNHLLRAGFPIDAFVPTTAGVATARNAEEALLLTLNACARATRITSKIAWPHHLSAGNWISRLRGQRSGPDNSVLMSCLSFMNFRECTLFGQDLCGADLTRSIFEKADLRHALFLDSDLTGADLTSADARRASFDRARLINTTLSESDIRGAHLANGRLTGVVAVGTLLDTEQERLIQRNGGTVRPAYPRMPVPPRQNNL